jgi:hypothetical protein
MTAAVDFEFEAAGAFSIGGDDPDFANGPAAKYWELAELARSPSRFVAEMAREMAGLVSDGAVKEAEIKAAREHRDWRPRAVLERLDDSERVFDVTLVEPEPGPLPATFKVFEFDE